MKNINEKELTNYILKRLQEGYFDEFEFDDSAMRAAMADIESDPTAGEFEELGSSKFEKGSDFGKELKSSLKQANLELPSDDAEVKYYAQLLKKRKAQEDRFGKGSLNEIKMEYIEDSKGNPIKLKSQVKDIETGVIGYVDSFMQDHDTLGMLVKVNWINRDKLNVANPIDPKKLIVKENTMMNEEAYEASRYMFFSNLQQIRRQAGLLLDMDENELNSILENGHDWAQDHIATAKESIDQVFDFIMNETNSGDMWKSVDVEDKEDEDEDEEGDEFDEEIEEGMGHSHTVGKGTNEKPVNYPETLMREAVKGAIEEVFGNFTSTASKYAKGGGFKKASLSTPLEQLSKFMGEKYPNQFTINTEMPPKTIDNKNPDAKKPVVYMWIPKTNTNSISVEYRNFPSAVNYVTSKKHIDTILNKFKTLGVLDQLVQGKNATQAKFSLVIKQTGAQAEPATTQTAIAEGYSVNEDEHIKLSFADKLKLWAKGISEEQALANLNAGLPIDWTGSVEGSYEHDEPRRDYSGTNEAIEEGLFNKKAGEEEANNAEKYVKTITKEKLMQAIKNLPKFGGGVSIKPDGESETKETMLKKQFWTGSDAGWHSFVDKVMSMKESSSDSLTNKHGKNAKPNVSYLKKEGYENIIELQDNQANHVFTLLKQDGPEEAIEYLKEFHKPGTHNILSEIKKNTLDKNYEKDGYTLTWNPSVGFVKLSYKAN